MNKLRKISLGNVPTCFHERLEKNGTCLDLNTNKVTTLYKCMMCGRIFLIKD